MKSQKLKSGALKSTNQSSTPTPPVRGDEANDATALPDSCSLPITPITPGTHTSQQAIGGRLASFAVPVSDTDYEDFEEGDALDVVPVSAPTKSHYVSVQRVPVARVYLLSHKPDGEDRPTKYLLTPDIALVLADDAVPHDLFRWVDREGREGLWPVSAVSTAWRRSELAAIAKAAESWHRLVYQRPVAGGMGARRAVRAGNPGAFGPPCWSTRTNEELVMLAFRDRLIEDVDHALVQQLLGME